MCGDDGFMTTAFTTHRCVIEGVLSLSLSASGGAQARKSPGRRRINWVSDKEALRVRAERYDVLKARTIAATNLRGLTLAVYVKRQGNGC